MCELCDGCMSASYLCEHGYQSCGNIHVRVVCINIVFIVSASGGSRKCDFVQVVLSRLPGLELCDENLDPTSIRCTWQLLGFRISFLVEGIVLIFRSDLIFMVKTQDVALSVY